MYKEVWNKYIKGFKFLLPFILVQILFKSTGLNLAFTDYDLFGKGGSLIENLSIFNQLIIDNIIPISLELFIGAIFYSFLMITIKSLLNEKNISYGEDFKESIGFYLRYLVLNIIISAISMVLIFLGFWTILIPFMVILMIYFNIILTPCEAYLVYYNTSVGESLKKGIELGKKYSGEIILIGIVTGIMLGVMGGIMSTLNITPKTNFIGYIFISFISTNIQIYFYMFVMSICKREEKAEEKTLELEY
ncbi:hypothetical protein EQG73_06860 [Clostridium tetani]|nr:hypothetical protein EQG73_06860 [Clostridium tetani]